ncbi:MAG: PLP-dependent lyase/thiolase [Actinomycetota bacterium]
MKHDVVGWRCAVSGAVVPIEAVDPWRSPRSTADDRRYVLLPIEALGAPSPARDDAHPFRRWEPRSAWAAAAAAHGMTDAARLALVSELDEAVARVDGSGFSITPFARSDALSESLGFSDAGGVWVKDETGNVGGSQKARHLFSILLLLRAQELLGVRSRDERAPLAIASCGNAALAAATLARAAEWPIDVYVPTWMSDGFGDVLDRLGARIHRCERRDTDPPGDPAMLRFREAVDRGAIPFTVQGPENALCLDGGRTIGWELAEQMSSTDGPPIGRIYVQVGGGAFAGCLGAGLADAAGPSAPALVAVQTEGCAPFERAVTALDAQGVTDDDERASRWGEVMHPWRDPSSLADGILDDETYDWIAVDRAIRRTHGEALVVPERTVVEAHHRAVDAGFAASPTGTAGLAGLVHDVAEGRVDRNARVAVVMSGVAR